jgi:hypothetical protein
MWWIFGGCYGDPQPAAQITDRKRMGTLRAHAPHPRPIALLAAAGRTTRQIADGLLPYPFTVIARTAAAGRPARTPGRALAVPQEALQGPGEHRQAA